MRKGLGILLLSAAVLAQGGLGGKITGGKAKRLVDQGLPLIQKADEVWNAWILDGIGPGELKAALKRAIRLYDEGTALLQQAVEIQNDAGVNHRLNIAARRLQKMRFYVSFKLERPTRPARPPVAPPPEEGKPVRNPEPEPPSEPPPPPPEDLVSDEPAPRVSFPQGDPPALPVDVDLPAFPGAQPTPDEEARAKRDRKAITQRVKDYLQAFKPKKLLARHRLCKGKGQFGPGAPCEECHGTGQQINLHYFRRAFWTSFTPALRDSEGALEALAVFFDRAQRDVSVLGPVVTSFKVREIDHQGVWAKARVAANTSAGKKDYAITLISIGSSWFLYHPATDRVLLPQEAPQ
ncbi:MAG: hypothetical protein ACYTEZ_11930 [Planctomycetota bacterium]